MNRLFTENHEWIEIDGDVGTVGISDHAVEELGEIVFVETQDEGVVLSKGDEFGSVESVKTVSGLFAPIGGEILEVNQSVINSPELVSSAPSDKGWIIKIKVASTPDDLMSESEYQAHIKSE